MKLTRKIIAFMLVVTLTVTSVNLFGTRAVAEITDGSQEKLDLSGITTDVNIVNNGDGNIVNALSGTTATIDGVTYNNYSRYNGVSAFASSDILGAANRVIDGDLNSRWETEHGTDPHYLTVDLGNVYAVKNIDIYWEGASAKEYEIQVSTDGNTFQTLANIQSNYGKRTDDIKLSSEIYIRAVKIYCISRTTIYGDSIYEIGIYGTEAQKEVVPILSGLKIVDYYKYTGKYFIYFTEPAQSSGYHVYIDDGETPVKTITGSGSYISSQELEGLTEGEHTLSVANTDATGKESARISTEFNISVTEGAYNDIPQIYIYTTGNVTNEYHDTADVTVSIIDKEGGSYADIIDSGSNIKIRGNTTATAPKKPWNIKLSSKKSVLGMDKGKKWCLLANSFDKSLMRNYLAYNFGLENGVTYTSQSRYAEVYINGTYNGNYLITEPVEAKTERVDVDAYNADSDDILLELGTRNEEGVDHFTTSVLWTTFDVNDPEKGDDLTDEEVDAKITRVKEYLNNFETALKNQNYDEILTYIDEDTFVNFYIVNELFKNVDFNFSSTRFYIKDGKIYAGPLWDFDLSSGNCKFSSYQDYYVDGVSYKGFYCQSMNWYRELLKNEAFYNKIKERYAQLQYKIQNIYKVNSVTQLSIDYLLNHHQNSFMRNYLSVSQLGAGWELTNDDGYSYSAESGWTSWEQPIQFLRDWIENRNVWLCQQWNVDMNAAYVAGKPQDEEETTKNPEETTTPSGSEEETPTPAGKNTVVAFSYDGTGQIAGEDMSGYAYEDNDYTYKATTGTGTMSGSVNGTNLKHIEWGSDVDYGIMVPVMPASKSNLWSKDAYISYTFSTMGYTNMKASIDVGGTKKGPANLIIGYYDNNEFQPLTTYSIGKNKTMYTVEFTLPETLENKDSVCIYVKLADTTNIGGNEMTDASYNSGGELAFNNFIVSKEESNVITGTDIAITGYQMTTSLGGVQGNIGIRTIYQIEQAANDENVKEFGLVIGLDNGEITDNDMMIGSNSNYVVNVASTENGKAGVKLGTSDSADYYVMTMDISAGYAQDYKVRPYAILQDGSVVYGDVDRFNVFDVAKIIYDSSFMPNLQSHNTLYQQVIKKVDSSYEEVEYTGQSFMSVMGKISP